MSDNRAPEPDEREPADAVRAASDSFAPQHPDLVRLGSAGDLRARQKRRRATIGATAVLTAATLAVGYALVVALDDPADKSSVSSAALPSPPVASDASTASTVAHPTPAVPSEANVPSPPTPPSQPPVAASNARPTTKNPSKPAAPSTPRSSSRPGSAVYGDPDEAPAVVLLKSFAPKGAEVIARDVDNGYGMTILEDGRGGSRVSANVQHNMQNVYDQLSTCAARGSQVLTCTEQPAPGGGRLLLITRNSEKGGNSIVWTADLVRPDGFRVLVSSVNAPTEESQAVRPAPILSLDRLKVIATDPRWEAL